MSEPGKPEYHCKKCDAIVNPTDEKCPNGHDLSIVGKKIKLTLTESLTLSDSVNLTSGFLINKIGNIVKALEPGPKTPEIQAELDDIKDIHKALLRAHATIEDTDTKTSARTKIASLEEFLKNAFIPWSKNPGWNLDAICVLGGLLVWAIVAIGNAFGIATIPSEVTEIGKAAFYAGIGRASKPKNT